VGLREKAVNLGAHRHAPTFYFGAAAGAIAFRDFNRLAYRSNRADYLVMAIGVFGD
jgi:hypothetical protein